ncbi:MAG: cation-transporting P-type ATPase [Candidatus Bathyarchaeia archaeon]
MANELQIYTEKKWHSLNIEDILQMFSTNIHGLTDEQAKAMLEKFGPNELATFKKFHR